MKDRVLLAGWLIAVIAITFVHDPLRLAVALVLVLIAQGLSAPGSVPGIVLRALAAVALVNLAVSVAWVGAAMVQGEPWGVFVLRLNLRVFLLALLSFWMIRHVDLVRATAFWPSLRFLVVLALGQIRAFKTMAADYRQALISRSPLRPSLGARFGSAGRQAAAMMEKAERQAEELNQGMQARGFFDDRA